MSTKQEEGPHVDPDAQRARGRAVRRKLWGPDEAKRVAVLQKHEPALADTVLRELFGTIYADDRLAPETRSLCTIASLVTQGRPHQLESHFRAALAIGIPASTLSAVLRHLAFYVGLPTVLEGFRTLDKVVGGEPGA